jgi:hypothetical protein
MSPVSNKIFWMSGCCWNFARQTLYMTSSRTWCQSARIGNDLLRPNWAATPRIDQPTNSNTKRTRWWSCSDFLYNFWMSNKLLCLNIMYVTMDRMKHAITWVWDHYEY